MGDQRRYFQTISRGGSGAVFQTLSGGGGGAESVFSNKMYIMELSNLKTYITVMLGLGYKK